LPRSINQFINQLLCGDARQVLRQFPDESIDCVVTSPPYWALRDYGVEGQLGLEPSFHEYTLKLCDIFDEVKRVLKTTGTCWVNLGDTYYSNHGGGNDGMDNVEVTKQLVSIKNWIRRRELAESRKMPLPDPLALCHRDE
jgi:DNA modification methylase